MIKDLEDIKGWQVESEEVREVASKMDIPSTQPLPEVIVVGKEAIESVQSEPQLHKDSSGQSPSGYFITIPESMLSKVGKTDYILGARTGENIRHELAHFMEHLEMGTEPGGEDNPYNLAAAEIRANLRAGVKRPSWRLALVIKTLVEDYSLSTRAAGDIVSRAATDLGINKWTISRAKRLYKEGRMGWGGERFEGE